MALVPYFILSPNTVLSIIGLIRGPDKTVPTPAEDWRKATVNVVIPAHNEQYTIVLCLASLMQQTLKPQRIILIDDGSEDHTFDYVKTFCEIHNFNVEIIQRAEPIGKTPTIKIQSRVFEADVEFILDGDTVLKSPNYIERCVEELYKGIGIASACGVILPLYDKQRLKMYDQEAVQKFLSVKKNAKMQIPRSWWQKVSQGYSNIFRDVLYTYLQRFLYIGQMDFFGSIVNPIGCAVAYRQKYVREFFDTYEPKFGDNLSNSEDIFIGFALLNKGYRNIQLQDVECRSREPHLERLPKQIYLWSSSFVQSCYFFPSLLFSPFKFFKRWIAKKRAKKFGVEELRKVQEAYRQPFGDELGKTRGRPMGWSIFWSLFEKCSFSIIFWAFIIMGWWEIIAWTVVLESFVALFILTAVAKGHRLKYFFKGILVTPLRYLAVLLDIFIITHFAIEVWIFRYRKWRK
jgi:glycosyltransferase involved in cell wall biosynthesis